MAGLYQGLVWVSVIQSLIYFVNKDFLSVYYMAGLLQVSEKIAVKKQQDLCPHGLYSLIL